MDNIECQYRILKRRIIKYYYIKENRLYFHRTQRAEHWKRKILEVEQIAEYRIEAENWE